MRTAGRLLGTIALGLLGTSLVEVSACQVPSDETAEDAVLAENAKTGSSSFAAFETGQVRPLAMSPNGKILYALNTPDNRLEVFATEHGSLLHVRSVPVGLEPIAVAARSNDEVWVVNHLSDSVSVVNVKDPRHAFVARTLLVGDEPRDIVFAGPNRTRAFVTTAHRGQNTGRDPELTKPGVGRADVWVFDANDLGASLGGTPLNVITLFADTPRALAASADGTTVYAAAFHSGNRTTSLNERVVTTYGGPPPPLKTGEGLDGPAGIGLIVKFRPDPSDNNALHWLDNIGRRWDDHVKLNLPDKDVFAIDAVASPPRAKDAGVYAGVGTTLFNMVVNPVNRKVYVTNTDARNDVRFEGHNESGPAQGAPAGSVRGHIVESRITVLNPDGGVTPRHLNKHIDYTKDGTPDEASKSLAFPTDAVVSADGASLYVTAFGSSKVGIFSTAELEAGTFQPSTHIEVSGGGPSGLALDEANGLLYVLTRFDNGLSMVDLKTRKEVGHTRMFNPEPPRVVKGRRFLYDATLTSSHGDSACASCHVFGDLDHLAWDLGNPDGTPIPVPGPFALAPDMLELIATIQGAPKQYSPLKGPMVTQSLRGMANHGPMHWRGDRTGGNDVPPGASKQPDTGTFDEVAAFKKFNVAFQGLLGAASPLSDADMQAFTDFALELMFPPNPIRNLDNSLTPDQEKGRAFYFSKNADGSELVSDRAHNCNGCHTLDPKGNAEFGVSKPGFFGTTGTASPEFRQFFKPPQMRDLYQKVGMFGMTTTFVDPNSALIQFLPAPYNDESHQGDQIRGFGYIHDGSVDTVFRFVGDNAAAAGPPVGPFPANPGGFPLITHPDDPVLAQQELLTNITMRRQVESFLLAFDSNLAPIVGQQVTLTDASGSDVFDRIDLLLTRAHAGECDVVAHGVVGGRSMGYAYDRSTRSFFANRRANARLERGSLHALGAGFALTFTAVPVGSGIRIGIDHDLNGVRDGDEPQHD